MVNYNSNPNINANHQLVDVPVLPNPVARDIQTILDHIDKTLTHVKVAPEMFTRQLVVGTTYTLIAPANPRRRALKITNLTGTGVFYVGVDRTVLSTTGDFVGSTQGSTWVTLSGNELWGIAAVAQTISVEEEMDYI